MSKLGFISPRSLIIKLNSGTTEGTNMFTFDNSTAKTVNISPSTIGAATSSHTHTKSQITDFPSTMKNPTAITVKLNSGTTEGTNLFTYDGSAAKSINITPSSIGAAASSHNHNASNINAGTLSLDRLPAAALTRITTVADTTALYQLTTAEVQLGDLVKCTGNGTTYVVKDESALSSGSGYEPITASSAASVAWNNVSGKPSTFTPATHTHTKSQITDFPASLKNPTAITVKLNSGATEGTNLFTYDGSAAKTVNITPSAIGAAASSHGTHVSYGTTAPAANGTASAGSATTVSRSDHVHPLQTTISGNAGSATKVNNNLVIKLNSGATEGTNLFTFNGSAAKSINITPSSIGAAASSHTHGNADITGLDASKLTGTIDIARLPAGALERCVVVKDDTARFALTTASVQVGDTVKVTDTGKMYFVVDAANLSTEDGYEVYTAGSATSVPWSGITGKPSTFTPATHTHTKSQITDFPASLKNPTSMVVKLNSGTTEGTNLFTYDGSAAKSINITASSIGAAAASHGTHVTYATAAPLANGTAAVGTSAKVAREDHVHPLQTTISGNAGSATKVNNNLVIKLNSGATEGTNLFTFNGSAAKSINITPSSIGAAASSHNHSAANITSGTLSLARLPESALTRITTVADTTALYKLTTAEVQLGDLVKCVANGTTYVVKDEANLTSADGYEAITAGSAASVAWNNVSGKPSTFTPSTHTHTKSQITDFPASLKNPTSMVVKLNSGTTEGTNMFTYDGSAAKTVNITASSIGAAASSHSHSYGASYTIITTSEIDAMFA